MTEESVLEWTHPGGRRRVIIERVPGNRFRFHEALLVEDEDFGVAYEYWREGEPSGLYPSVLDAQNDAANGLPWLRALLDV
jgi:hypothetical protein